MGSELKAKEPPAGPARRSASSRSIEFSPLLRTPAVAGPSKDRALLQTAGIEQIPSERVEARALGVEDSPSEYKATLEGVLGKFVDTQRGLAKGNPGHNAKLPDESEMVSSPLQSCYGGELIVSKMVNDEGLPIQEIREDAEGRSLDPIEAPTNSISVAPFNTEEESNDYWTEAAVARRAALRRRIFSQGDESDEADAYDSHIHISSPSPTSESRSTTIPPLSPIRSESPSASTLTNHLPKSILKPAVRKKSVSFDDSVPLPSGSMAVSNMHRAVVPIPIDEFEPRPVPLLQEPKPAARRDVSAKGFAGLRKGFLTGPSRARDPEQETRKLSLFAQRKAEHAIDPSVSASPAPLPPAGPRHDINLPKMSDSKPMASMKSTVQEKMPTPLTASINSARPIHPQSVGPVSAEDTESIADEDDGFDEASDDGDEFELDDALLARETALEFHRRRAYRSLQTDEDDGADRVMIGLPRIANGARIANPTPDDLRRFVRVGKLENGNLVLAPGEAGWSDEDEIGEEDMEKREGRRRRGEMKRRLMGLDGDGNSPLSRMTGGGLGIGKPVEVVKVSPLENATVKGVERSAEVPSEPSPQLRATPPSEKDPPPPNKVSRFKAARMGGTA